MNILVTGGCGFIGSHTAEALVALGHKVRVLDNLSNGKEQNIAQIRDKVEFILGDVADPAAVKAALKNIEWVVHLAALADIVPSVQNPESYFKSNVQGTFTLLEECRNQNIKRFVYAASGSCYGIPDVYPTPETAEIKPQYPYALTKRLGEELVLHWAQIYKLPALALRFFNVYGPRSRTSGTYGAVFGVFLAQKLAKKPFTIVGDGSQTRDFTYVSDVVDAVIAALNSNIVGEIYNVGSGQSISVNRIVELLGGEKIHIPKRPGEPDQTFADITKIKRDLKWTPKVPIEEGIKSLLDHINYWKDAPVWTPDKIGEATKDWFKFLS